MTHIKNNKLKYKFLAWYYESNQTFYPSLIYKNGDVKHPEYGRLSQDKFCMNQFIGIEDINSIEIYDNMIVKVPFIYGVTTGFIGRVDFWERKILSLEIDGDFVKEWIGLYNTDKLEVLGWVFDYKEKENK
jgi:hypothetical protein